MIFTELGNVDQPVDVILQLDKRPKTRDFCGLAGNEIADLVFRVDFLPRIVAQLFNAEADSLVDLVDVNDDRFYFVVLLKYFAGMIDLSGPA